MDDEIICMYCKNVYNKKTQQYTPTIDKNKEYSHGICTSLDCMIKLARDSTQSEAEFEQLIIELIENE